MFSFFKKSHSYQQRSLSHLPDMSERDAIEKRLTELQDCFCDVPIKEDAAAAAAVAQRITRQTRAPFDSHWGGLPWLATDEA
jgi:hypothetical protein